MSDAVGNLPDMGFFVQPRLAESPDLGIGGVAQPETPVRAENRDALMQIVERLALNGQEGVVGALDLEPITDVFVDLDDAAKGVWMEGRAQRSPVRKVVALFFRLHQALELAEALTTEGLVVGLFGQTAVIPKPPQHLGHVRLLVE